MYSPLINKSSDFILQILSSSWNRQLLQFWRQNRIIHERILLFCIIYSSKFNAFSEVHLQVTTASKQTISPAKSAKSIFSFYNSSLEAFEKNSRLIKTHVIHWYKVCYCRNFRKEFSQVKRNLLFVKNNEWRDHWTKPKMLLDSIVGELVIILFVSMPCRLKVPIQFRLQKTLL